MIVKFHAAEFGLTKTVDPPSLFAQACAIMPVLRKKIGSGTNGPPRGTFAEAWHDRCVSAPARIVLRSLADPAGLDVPSATPPTRHPIGERLGEASDRCWEACITNVCRRPRWRDRVIAEHSGGLLDPATLSLRASLRTGNCPA